ncbi:hypothetical protein BDV12DRAFT_181431 [Aspergillus spectabilis]
MIVDHWLTMPVFSDMSILAPLLSAIAHFKTLAFSPQNSHSFLKEASLEASDPLFVCVVYSRAALQRVKAFIGGESGWQRMQLIAASAEGASLVTSSPRLSLVPCVLNTFLLHL